MRLSFLIFLLFIFSFSSAQVYNVFDLYSDNYDRVYIKENRIRSMTIKLRDALYSKSGTSFHFDSLGYLMYYISVNDTSDRKVVYTRNERNDIVLYTTFKDGKVETTDTLEKLYDGNNLVKETLIFKYQILLHSYNNSNQRIRTITRPANGILYNTLNYSTDIFYNSSGKPSEKIVKGSYNNNDTILLSHIFFNYEKGKLVKEDEKVAPSVYNPISKGNVTYNYDIEGRLISIIRPYASSHYLTYKDNLVISVKTVMPEDLDSFTMIDDIQYTFY